jgi:hypothetical protein
MENSEKENNFLLHSAPSLNPSRGQHCLINQLAPTVLTLSGPGLIPKPHFICIFFTKQQACQLEVSV